MADLKVLMDMGFDSDRAALALKHGGDGTQRSPPPKGIVDRC